MMGLRARLFKFLIDMGRISIDDVPEPYRTELSQE